MRNIEPQPALQREAREWLIDCGAPVAAVRQASWTEIRREVERQYDGGWRGFVADGGWER